MNRTAQRIALTLLTSSALMSAWAGGTATPNVTPAATPAPEPVAPAPTSEQIYLESEFLFVESPDIQTYLERLIEKLLAGRTEKFTRPRLLIYSTPDFDARSDTSGNILISTETLRALESEDELAALLGHELAHVVLSHPNKKSFVQSIPVGVESMNAIAAAGHQLVQTQKQNTATPTESRFVRKSAVGTQNFSEFWCDLLAPNWNRKQEREADRVGFDMMRAAGYDPAAFATLFSKLHAAQLKRGQRMELLRKELLARAQKPEVKSSAAAGTAEAGLTESLNGLKDAVSAKAVDSVFDGIAKATADYDSPEQRQEQLAKYASEKSNGRRDKTARSVKFAQTLREGAGGTLLGVDASAQRLMVALQTGDEKTAAEAAAVLLPETATAKKPDKASTKTSKQKKDAGKNKAVQVARIPAPLSPHLNLALSSWFEHGKQLDLADQRLVEWLRYARAPSLAFVQHAGYQAERGEFDAAVVTLDDGTRRVGTPKSFLPTLVSVAKAANNNPGAEEYTKRCNEEDHRNQTTTGKIKALFATSSVPTGLYAECVARLGHVPAGVSGGTSLSQAPVNAINSLTESVKKSK